MLTNHKLYSGGAYGADTAFGVYGLKYGITPDRQFHFRPEENPNVSKQLKEFNIHPTIMDNIQMEECYKFMAQCFDKKKLKTVKRTYADDLKARNYYQVKHAQAIYAVAEMKPDFQGVRGGTNYAVQYAISLNKLVYVFDFSQESWYVWVNKMEGFQRFHDTPLLFTNFAGIGSRSIQKYQVKDKTTNEWVDNKDYVGDDLKKVALAAIKKLYEDAWNIESLKQLI